MSYERLLELNKTCITHHDVAQTLGIKLGSAEVWCSRYVRKGLLTRLKRGLYVKTENLAHMSQTGLFEIANILQVPSYISLMTALSYYGITTQVQRNFLESISSSFHSSIARAPIRLYPFPLGYHQRSFFSASSHIAARNLKKGRFNFLILLRVP